MEDGHAGRGADALVSDRASLPEVTGDAALAVDPLDVDALADGLQRITSDDRLRRTLRIRGLQRVQRYSRDEAGHAAVTALDAAFARARARNGR